MSTLHSFTRQHLLDHGFRNESVEGLALDGELLHLDEEGDTIDDELQELDLGITDTIGVGDVVGAVAGGGVDTPVPRFWRRRRSKTESSFFSSLARLGSLTWTPARRPVPKLDGQVRTYPRCSFHM